MYYTCLYHRVSNRISDRFLISYGTTTLSDRRTIDLDFLHSIVNTSMSSAMCILQCKVSTVSSVVSSGHGQKLNLQWSGIIIFFLGGGWRRNRRTRRGGILSQVLRQVPRISARRPLRVKRIHTRRHIISSMTRRRPIKTTIMMTILCSVPLSRAHT